jgi:hypothetical protein
MDFWCTFFLLAGSGVAAQYKLQWLFWRASNYKKKAQADITISSGLSHPTRSLSRIVCRQQEGNKEDALRPDLKANI